MRPYAIALAATSLALLSACTTPPGEIDSHHRVDTVKDIAAPTSTTKTPTSPASAGGSGRSEGAGGSGLGQSNASTTITSTPAGAGASITAESTTATPTSYMVHASRGIPGVIDCVGSPTKRPNTLSLSCSNTGDRLKNIKWETWNETTAKGTATRETHICNGTVCKHKDGNGQTTETQVTVELSQPTMTPQGPAFTLITVNGASIVL